MIEQFVDMKMKDIILNTWKNKLSYPLNHKDIEELEGIIDYCEGENQKLKKQLDCALGLLSEMYPPCEKDGFMDKHSDYCELNCGVDEEIFKKCWLMYIKDKVSEVE